MYLTHIIKRIGLLLALASHTLAVSLNPSNYPGEYISVSRLKAGMDV